MNVEYDKVYPGGNTTAIVQTRVSEAQRSPIAAAIMAADTTIEQVGFLRPSDVADARLDMMGGELCINAVRSVAAIVGKTNPTKTTVSIHTATLREPLLCTNSYTDDAGLNVGVNWQVEYKLDELDEEHGVVHLGDISHVLCRRDELPSEAETDTIFAVVSKRFAHLLDGLLAFGIIPFVVAGEKYHIRPVVHVPAVPSTIPETGCGSGSLALALAVLMPTGGQLEVVQPSGVPYRITIAESDGVIQASLESPVEVLGRRTIAVDVE